MIWIIGGTSDANKIAKLLVEQGKKVLVSTTTSYGSELAQLNDVLVIQQKLSTNDMRLLIKEHAVEQVIDASHPFATEVSTSAIKVCADEKVKYIRYERPSYTCENARYYQSYDEMIAHLQQTEGNILLTIGSKNIGLFKDFATGRIIARVLPVVDSIELCEKAGLSAHQIIATKGIMTKETNMALMKEYNIKHLVTKESGEAGGMKEKVDAAHELTVDVHVLGRPKIEYPVVINYIETLLH